eukprot:4087921-Lingulodinium_polyedra.AAC.1
MAGPGPWRGGPRPRGWGPGGPSPGFPGFGPHRHARAPAREGQIATIPKQGGRALRGGVWRRSERRS